MSSEVMLPETGVMSPEISCEDSKKCEWVKNLVRVKCETQVVRFTVVSYHGDCNPKTSRRLEHWKTPPSCLQHVLRQESSHGCKARLRHCGKFRHALTQTYLLLAAKPNSTRGRVGRPSDTRPLKTNSNANLSS